MIDYILLRHFFAAVLQNELNFLSSPSRRHEVKYFMKEHLSFHGPKVSRDIFVLKPFKIWMKNSVILPIIKL